jgi:hypothetical protein
MGKVQKAIEQQQRFRKLQDKLGMQTKSIVEDEPLETQDPSLFEEYTNPKAMQVDREYSRARRDADKATGSEAGQTMDDYLKSSGKPTLSTKDLLIENELPDEYYPSVARELQKLREARLRNLK